MKNKKLFAILTLVCFMFTLMPVAAFAADYTFVVTSEANDAQVSFDPGTTGYVLGFSHNGTTVDDYDWQTTAYTGQIWASAFDATGKGYLAVYAPGTDASGNPIYTEVAKQNVTATMVKNYTTVATGEAKTDVSALIAKDGNQTITDTKADTTGVVFVLTAQDANRNSAKFNGGELYIWAKDAAGNITSALKQPAGFGASDIEGVYKSTGDFTDKTEITLNFARGGEFTVYAGYAKTVQGNAIDELNEIKVLSASAPSTIKVTSASANPENYTAQLNKLPDVAVDGVLGSLSIIPNNVMSNAQYVTFYGENHKALVGKTVTIETNSAAIEVNKTSAVTNGLGQIDFKVSASVEGTYEIDFIVDGVAWTVKVQVGSTSAAYIALDEQPAAPQALYGTMKNDKVTFAITDINGNVVDTVFDGGMKGIDNNDGTPVDRANTDANMVGKYIVLTEKPEASNLESEDLYLTYADGVWGLNGVTKDAEGTYTVKVILDNGAFATATWEVKKFQKPVMLMIGTSTDVIELGAAINGELLYIDANGVQKDATDVELAVTGYAVAKAEQAPVAGLTDNHNFKITVKDDEKYVGAVVTATAVSEKYDLVATKDFTVADGAVAIAFVDKAADVNVNNKLEWNVVNSEGTRVALVGAGAIEAVTIDYVVLDKPEGAKVSVNNVNTGNDLLNKGIGKMALTSNKVGNVTVQVIMKAKYETTADAVSQTKYYTGTQIIAVGTQGVGDVVVMSIGSNEIVINDAKGTIPAAPIVENNRTFVPFRALAEAFGAEVAWDEATQAVTASLNGVEIVMTIGSAEYTINGEVATMDVAPFINGASTMVPVRFAAEAFGIKVIPTYDENGATADILFNL